MNEAIRDVVQSLLPLAERNGWDEVTRKARALLDAPGAPDTVLLQQPGEPPTALRAWLSAQCRTDMNARSFSEAAGHSPLRSAGRLIGAFTAGRLIETSEAKIIEQVFFKRPLTSTAIVLVCDEQPATLDAFEALQQAAWRLLVKSPPRNTTAANLAEHQVFFWSANADHPLLAERIRADSEALAAWLKAPSGDGHALEIGVAAELLEDAEESLRRQRVTRISTRTDGIRSVGDLLDRVQELRRRLGFRLDSETEVLVTKATAALREWEVRLKTDLEREFEAVCRGGSLHPSRVQELIGNHLQQAQAHWAEKLAALIERENEWLTSDLKELVALVEWNKVNFLLGATAGNNWPERIFRNIGRAAIPSYGLHAGDVGTPNAEAGRSNGLFVGIPVSTGVAILMLGQVGALMAFATALTAGWLSSKAFARNSTNGCDLPACLECSGESVRRFSSGAIGFFENETRLAVASIRRQYDERFQELERALGDAIQEKHEAPIEPREDLEAALRSLRARLGSEAK